MKICICCNAQVRDEVSTCANCGEASWRSVPNESADIPERVLPHVPIVDPNAAIEVPRVRRNKRSP